MYVWMILITVIGYLNTIKNTEYRKRNFQRVIENEIFIKSKDFIKEKIFIKSRDFIKKEIIYKIKGFYKGKYLFRNK